MARRRFFSKLMGQTFPRIWLLLLKVLLSKLNVTPPPGKEHVKDVKLTTIGTAEKDKKSIAANPLVRDGQKLTSRVTRTTCSPSYRI
ncbi:MAG TPA: hypothetical protein VGZ73_28060 [Bryobacteraceae bacterium]|jgi:hypothetical protein|nr:hypothetical protein [Bryobacteraceae bacterium]